MKSTLYLTLLMLIVFTSCGKKQANQNKFVPQQNDLKAFENQMSELTKTLGITKLTYAVANDEKIIDIKNIGEDKTENAENLAYEIGELNNLFIASTILKFAENEKIKINNCAGDYISDCKPYCNSKIKDLLAYVTKNNSVTNYEYNNANYKILQNIIEAVSGKSSEKAIEKYVTGKFDMDNTHFDSKTGKWMSTIHDLNLFSEAFDNYAMFSDSGIYDVMYRPFYFDDGRKSPTGLGWFVQVYNDRKYIWSFSQGNGYSAIIIKSLTDRFSLLVLANSENLNKPFNLEKGNVFASPLAVNFVSDFFLKNDSLPVLKGLSTPDDMKKYLEKASQSNHFELLANNYLSYIKMFRYMNKVDRANELGSVYKEVFPLDKSIDLIDKPCIASIDNVGDYMMLKKPFSIMSDTTVSLFTVGEIVNELNMSPWEYENIELYFDMENTKEKKFDRSKYHCQYRFDYNYPEITGDFMSQANIRFAFADHSKKSYVLEVCFPWKTLGKIIPQTGVKFGFDISAGDNDGKSRLCALSWNSEKNQQPWADVSVLGTLMLNDNASLTDSKSVCYSVKITSPVIVDGEIDKAWNSIPKYPMNKVYIGELSSTNLFASSFRSIWDNDNIYFLVEVTDDIKAKLPQSMDYGFIENEQHDTIWQMNMENSQFAGGEKTNRYVNTTLKLKKGNYILKYSTNQRNSPSQWIRKHPDMNFYGIVIY